MALAPPNGGLAAELGLEALVDALAERLAPRVAAQVLDALTGGQEDGWMTTRQAADYLGIRPNALHKLTASRAIPFTQDGAGCRCYFKRSELDRWRAEGPIGRRSDASTSLPRG